MRGGLLLLLFLASALVGQETKLQLLHASGAPALSADFLAAPGTQGSQGFGFVAVDVENHTNEPREVEVTLLNGYGGTGFRATQRLRLKSVGKERVWLPHPTSTVYGLHADLASAGLNQRVNLNASPKPGRTLLVATEPKLVADWIGGFASFLASTPAKTARKTGGRASASSDELLARTPADLPPTWQWLTGFAAIVVDASAEGLTAERQQVLASYARGGGHLIVLRSGSGTAGPLKELASGSAGSAAARGLVPCLGRVLAAEDDGLDALDSGNLKTLLKEAHDLHTSESPRVGTLPADLLLYRSITGLGAPPVRAFTLLTLGFIVFVLGALYYQIRRKKQPLRLLLVLPGAGFGTAGLVLAFGFFSEGLTPKGASDAITLLDQRTQQHVTIAGRSLFAPFSPSRLANAASTAVFGLEFPPTSWDSRGHALELDLDRSMSASGAALPARSMTNFMTVTVGSSRERIRFQKDGVSWRMLTAPGLVPEASERSVLLCDLGGRFWTNRRDGSMEPCADATARLEALEAKVARGTVDPRRNGPPSAVVPESPTRSTPDWVRNRFPRSPAPGTYVAVATENALFDDLGVRTEWSRRSHLVYGILSSEDFLP